MTVASEEVQRAAGHPSLYFPKRWKRCHVTAADEARITSAIRDLPRHFAGELTALDVERIQSSREGIWRLRVGSFRIFFVVAVGSILVLELDRRDDHTYGDVDRLDRLAIVRRDEGLQVIEVAEVPVSVPGAVERRLPARVARPSTRQNPLTPFTSGRLEALGLDNETVAEIRTMARTIDIAETLSQRGLPASVVELASDAWHDPGRYLEIFDEGRVPTRDDAGIDEAELGRRLRHPDSIDSLAALTEGDFELVLRGEIEEWMFYLHPSQARIVRHEANGPSRVRGGPGTGKTVAALHRARHLVSAGCAESVLLTTFVGVLPAVWKQLFQTFAPEIAARIATATVDQLARSIVVESDGPVGTILGDGSDERRKLLERAIMKTDGLAGVIGGPENLGREIDEIIAGRGIPSRDEYLAVSRRGRGVALGRADRETVWQGYGRYRRELEHAGALDWAQLRLRALELASAGEGPRFDAVVVDEAQDLKEIQVKLLMELDTSPAHANLLIVGDGQQSIYPGGFTLGSLGLDVRGRSFLLRTNWRNTQRIAEAAESAIGSLPFGDLEAELGPRPAREAPLPRRVGSAPELHIVDPEREVVVLQELVSDALGHLESRDIGVLGRKEKVWRRAETALRAAEIPVLRLKDYRGQPLDGVRIGTFAGSKGLEFKFAILLAGKSDWSVSPFMLKDQGDIEEWWAKERRTLFVAMTRARDRLAILSGPELAAPVTQAREHFDEWDWR